VQVGNADAVFTMAYTGGSMDFASNSAVEWWNTNTGNEDYNIWIDKIDDPSFYATTTSEFDRANKIQNCEAVLKLDKIDVEDALF